MIPMREVSPTDAATRKQCVTSEKFLKKCHVEHKRIGGVARKGVDLKLNSGDSNPAGCGAENLIDDEFRRLYRETPLKREIC